MNFSPRAIELFQRKLYQGLTFEPDATALAGSFGSGRFAMVVLRCEDGLVAEARYRTMNCISAIAAADWACEWAQGRSHQELQKLRTEDILDALDSLPQSRVFCAHLVRDALALAAQEALQKGLLL